MHKHTFSIPYAIRLRILSRLCYDIQVENQHPHIYYAGHKKGVDIFI